jgi:GTP-binding protein Era
MNSDSILDSGFDPELGIEHDFELDPELDLDLDFDPELGGEHRAGFVSVLGRPNAGKSTLMNAYLGQKVSIVSPKPQTTRRRILGILTLDPAQVIFVDTPGIHTPVHKLGEVMVHTAVQAIPDADVLLLLVDASRSPDVEDRQIAELLIERGQGIPLILGLNKSDLVPQKDRALRASAYLELIQPERWLWVSATEGENREEMLQVLVQHLPLSPCFYPEDQVTDQTERVIAAELIREQVLRYTFQEVPHAVEVRVDEFSVRSKDLTYIYATIVVERSTQKGILLGQGGRMIKKISRAARQEIERMLDTRVYLDLWVKVYLKWRHKEAELARLGFV